MLHVTQYRQIETNVIKTECYELKSSKTPKQVKDLILFENVLIALVQNIRSGKTRNHKDIELIKSLDKTVTIANKTTELYRLTKAECNHMFQGL